MRSKTVIAALAATLAMCLTARAELVFPGYGFVSFSYVETSELFVGIRLQPAHVVCGTQRLSNNRDL
jgi:hypothetical protein